MARYYFDIQDGSGLALDDMGTELPDDVAARAEASSTIAAIARDQISSVAGSENIVIWVRRETGEPLAILTLSFALLPTVAPQSRSERRAESPKV